MATKTQRHKDKLDTDLHGLDKSEKDKKESATKGTESKKKFSVFNFDLADFTCEY